MIITKIAVDKEDKLNWISGAHVSVEAVMLWLVRSWRTSWCKEK
jgi:hypothetical protein